MAVNRKSTKLEGFKKVCPLCGREFWGVFSDWTYCKREKGKKIYYCSWKCQRRKEAEDENTGSGDADE